MTDEAIEEAEKRDPSYTDVFFYYRFHGGHPGVQLKVGLRKGSDPCGNTVNTCDLAQGLTL